MFSSDEKAQDYLRGGRVSLCRPYPYKVIYCDCRNSFRQVVPHEFNEKGCRPCPAPLIEYVAFAYFLYEGIPAGSKRAHSYVAFPSSPTPNATKTLVSVISPDLVVLRMFNHPCACLLPSGNVTTS